MAPAVDPLIGVSLGNYVVRDRIGAGGMGVVYRADQPNIARSVAVKLLKPEVAADPDSLRRLLDEARIVNAIQHRGIVGIFDYGTAPNGRQYVVMELLEGEPLDVHLARRGKLTAAEAIPILDEILSAVGAAHRQSVVHRDLKPGNVFYVRQPDGTRYIKVLDFGLAKRATRPDGQVSQTAFRPLGTPEYMAPEQAKGGKVSPRTDLYAVGVIAYELLTGDLPFEGPTALEILLKATREPPPSPSHKDASIPPSLEALVLELLEKDPALRPQTADQVRARLKLIARELAVAGTRVDLLSSADPSPTPESPTDARQTAPISGDMPTQRLEAAPALPGPHTPRAPSTDPDPPALPAPNTDRELPRRARSRRWPFAVAGALGGFAVVAILAARPSSRPSPNPVATQPGPPSSAPLNPVRVPVAAQSSPPSPVVVKPPPPPSPHAPPSAPLAPTVKELRAQLARLTERVGQLEQRGQSAPERRFVLIEADQRLQTGKLSEVDRRQLGKALADFASQLDEP
jgi:serine/threonine protein kinase